jgi:4-hydroxy-3-polyprenylbenzoate decarboxylase
LPNADFVIKGHDDQREPCPTKVRSRDHTGYYTLPESYPVCHVIAQPSGSGLR